MTCQAFDRMPQKGAMMLLESIVDIGESTITCRARDHRGADYPLRIDGRLMGASLVELGAQAAAAHASMYGIDGRHAGLLLALHDVTILLADADDAIGRLTCAAERIFFDDGFARYCFSVRDEDDVRIYGQATLKMQAIEP
jgi:predicted hotdog family 3-hydroxylacyl-ACP dehydratase